MAAYQDSNFTGTTSSYIFASWTSGFVDRVSFAFSNYEERNDNKENVFTFF